MKKFWDSITPCVRVILLTIAVTTLALYAGFRQVGELAFSPAGVASGKVWQLATHAFVSSCMMEFITGLITIAIFGPRLELTWGKSQFVTYLCGVAVLTGLFAWAVLPKHAAFAGLNCIYISLLVGWWRMFPYDQMQLMIGSPTYQVREIMIGFVVLAHILAYFGGGARAVLLCFGTALCAWFFLSAKAWLNDRRRAVHTPSKRMSGLEF